MVLRRILSFFRCRLSVASEAQAQAVAKIHMLEVLRKRVDI